MFKLLFIPIMEPEIMLQICSYFFFQQTLLSFFSEKVLLSSEDRNSERQFILGSPCLSIS